LYSSPYIIGVIDQGGWDRLDM